MGTRATVHIKTTRGLASLRADLASTPEERARGLMWRDNIGPDEGMYFALPAAGFWGFHMANTPLALDLIFVLRGVVTGAERGEPYDPNAFLGPGPYDAVVEAPAGFVARYGVQAGDLVTLDFAEAT